jgi:NAD-specific glutamate dehydrogenase
MGALANGADLASSGKLVAAWEGRNQRSIQRVDQVVGELRSASLVDTAMLSVALRELRNLA